MFLNSELSVQMALLAVHDYKEKDYNASAIMMNIEDRLRFARNPMASPKTSNVAHEKAYTSTITQLATGNIDT